MNSWFQCSFLPLLLTNTFVLLSFYHSCYWHFVLSSSLEKRHNIKKVSIVLQPLLFMTNLCDRSCNKWEGVSDQLCKCVRVFHKILHDQLSFFLRFIVSCIVCFYEHPEEVRCLIVSVKIDIFFTCFSLFFIINFIHLFFLWSFIFFLFNFFIVSWNFFIDFFFFCYFIIVVIGLLWFVSVNLVR